MRTVMRLPPYLIYIIDHAKFEAGVIFYGCVIALVLQVSSIGASYAGSHGFKPIMLPYAEAQPHGPALEAVAAQPALRAAAMPVGGSIWPIHGMVTTEFGAPDYPFQTHHTGIDISTSRPAGATAVLAFRAGTVTAVVHSYSSYGNHVIIDHGGGLTSLYGHLYDIRVSPGQQVSAGDVIGSEGSTGASTGPHLHFEIRQNNVPQNPRRYLPGNP